MLECLTFSIAIEGGKKPGLASNRLSFVELGYLGKDAFRYKLEQRVGKQDRRGSDYRDSPFATTSISCLEEHSSKESEAGQDLDSNNQGNDHKSQEIPMEVSESVHSIAAYVTAVDKVEDLHEDEAIPAQCEMFHLIFTEAEDVLINSLSRW